MGQGLKGKCAVLVVAFNAADALESCLSSLAWVKDDPGYRVYIADNSNSAEIRQLIAAKFPWMSFSVNSENLGFARANNKLYELAKSEFQPDLLLLVNPDLTITHDCVEGLRLSIQNEPEFGIIGPRLQNSEGTTEDSVLMSPTFFRLAAKFVSDILTGSNQNTLSYYLGDRSEVDAVSGACMLINCRAIETAGFFNENFFMYFEDNDLCARFRERDWKIIYDPTISAVHGLGKSSEARPDVKNWRTEQMYLSLIVYFKLNSSRLEAWLVRIMLIKLLWMRIVIGRDREWAKSVLAKIKEIK